jgi:hypothetical protein
VKVIDLAGAEACPGCAGFGSTETPYGEVECKACTGSGVAQPDALFDLSYRDLYVLPTRQSQHVLQRALAAHTPAEAIAIMRAAVRR